ncbi:MAG: hypothetical protein NVV82_28965 [Sporocytophaga sp.]|nr:hypothetical protein [Sporocytophaga sp.]
MKNRLVKLSAACTIYLSTFLHTQGFSQATQNVTDKQRSDSSLCFVKPNIKITKFYSKDELNKLQKLDLIEVYKSRLAYLIEILPFLSLNPAPGASFHEMSIPETETNISHLEKEMKNKQDFIKSLFETLDDVVPYSEKTNIIWSILYFDEMIKRSINQSK